MHDSKPAANAVSNPFRFPSGAWLAVPLCACAFLVWSNALRVQRVQYVSDTAESSGAEPAAGPARWQPRLIVPGHDNTSYEWLDQTRLMFARREWRVRHIDYENAPFGRKVDAASPYRWWLGTLAWLDHAVSGRPAGPAVERAALVADPLLQLLLLAGAAIFTAWQFGAFPAALLSVGIVTVFPFASEFLPGAPNDQGLVQSCVFWSVLTLLPGIRAAHSADAGRAGRWFFIAGVIGGLGVWIGAPVQVPVLGGIALGAVLAAWITRYQPLERPVEAIPILPWAAWAFGGATAILAGYLIEYFPAHLGSWQLRVVHPLYGLAWLGGGVLLAWVAAWIQGEKPGRGLREIGVWVLATAALASLPVAMWRTHSLGFLETELSALQLTRLPGNTAVSSLWAWMVHEGVTPRVLAALLPALLVLPAIWLIVRHRTTTASRVALVVALGPVSVAIGFACRQLSWWNPADAALLVLLVAATAVLGDLAGRRLIRWIWPGLLAPVFCLGALQVIPPTGAGTKTALDESEVLGLVERDLARWLAMRVGTAPAVILAPHNQGVTLYYYGRLRGLATLSRDNLDGLGAAIRIVSASTPEEAKELIDQRGVTHIVIPSWDPYLETYTRMGMGKVEGTFYERLTYWMLPPWLRPVAYQFPTIPGFEGYSVTILEVVEDQNDAAALSRSAEYFVEMGLLDRAASAAESLRRFPADAGALTARAQVEIARGDKAGFDRTVESLLRRLASGADRSLSWDRRVSLAVVLARSDHPDMAQEQVRRCLAEIDEAKVRSLSTGSLYRLQVLGKAYGLAITDQHLHRLALDLLPGDLRARLAQ